MNEFNTRADNVVFVTIDHRNFIAPLSGYAVNGVSTIGTEGVLIFIPIRSQDVLKDLIKVDK